MTKGLNPLAIFNLVDTVLKVGIEKAKKDVEEEGVEIIEKFLVEKESVILRLSDFAEQVFNRIHPKSVASVPFLNKGATPPWARVCGRSPAVPSLKVAPQKCTSSKW